MSSTKALHDAARRYCDDRAAHWHEVRAQLRETGRRVGGDWAYSDAALDVFARYEVLAAILADVERLTPADLGRIDEAREWLALAGQTAQNSYTRDITDPIEQGVIAAERGAFEAYVRGLSVEALAVISPMPFRRVLPPAESRQRLSELVRTWGHWYGGSVDRADVPPYSTLQASKLDDARLETIREVLRAHLASANVFEFPEFVGEESYELAVELADLTYGRPGEGFWSSPPYDWLVYASHEDSLTVGGVWLRDALRERWPDWRELLYLHWDGKGQPWTD